jgi:hypothetical protein
MCFIASLGHADDMGLEVWSIADKDTSVNQTSFI